MNENLLQISINNHVTTSLVDTGASVSCVSEDFCVKLFPNLYQKQKGSPVINQAAFKAIRGVCGETHPVKGTINLEVNINGLKITQTFHIFSRLQNTVILGIDFLKTSKAQIDVAQGLISFCDGMVHSPLFPKALTTVSNKGTTVCSVILKPRSQTIVPVEVPQHFHDSVALIEPIRTQQKSKYMIGKCISPVWGKYTQCLLLNSSNVPIHLKQGHVIGDIVAIDSSFPTQDIDTKVISPQSVNSVDTPTENNQAAHNYMQVAKELNIDLSNSDLTEDQKLRLLTCIGQNRQVFATNLSELGSTSVYKHRIDTVDDVPVTSRHYRLSKEIN